MIRMALFLFVMSVNVIAGEEFQQLSDNTDFYAERPATIECVIEAAQRQLVPVNVLLALASNEGGKNGSAVKNLNGSFDFGHFQINSIHWDKGGAFENNPNITKEYVRWRGCYNAELAAWLLKKALVENTGQDFWTRAANYHNKKPEFNAIYRKKLIASAISWGNYLKQRYPQVSITKQ